MKNNSNWLCQIKELYKYRTNYTLLSKLIGYKKYYPPRSVYGRAYAILKENNCI